MAKRQKSAKRTTANIKSDLEPCPDSWVWSHYKAQLPQFESEKAMLHCALAQAGASTVNKEKPMNLHMNKQPPLILPAILIITILSIGLIYMLSDRVIKLQLYRLASYENICGDPPRVNGGGIEFVQETARRESCLVSNGRSGVGFLSSLKILKEVLLDEE